MRLLVDSPELWQISPTFVGILQQPIARNPRTEQSPQYQGIKAPHSGTLMVELAARLIGSARSCGLG